MRNEGKIISWRRDSSLPHHWAVASQGSVPPPPLVGVSLGEAEACELCSLWAFWGAPARPDRKAKSRQEQQQQKGHPKRDKCSEGLGMGFTRGQPTSRPLEPTPAARRL